MTQQFRRAFRTQLNIVPIILELKLFEMRRFESQSARSRAQEEMDERLSQRFAEFISRMRGAFVKMAQVLGSLDPAPVRPAYVKRLEPMVDGAPGGRPWRQVERQINRELARAGQGNIESVFESFDKEPIGTASVGQVHHAVLRDSSRSVAVKLQYPDARRLILTDLGNIHRVLKVLGKPAEAGVVKEYRSRMSQEFDYFAEGRTMNEVADHFGGSHSTLGRRIKVPRCIQALSTRRLLVMDYVEGVSLRDDLRGRATRARSRPAPLRWPTLLLLQRDAKAKLKLMLDAQAEQIFRLGTFNADPHPGNVLLLPHDGRAASELALLDFGCHKTLTVSQRTTLAKLYIGFAESDEDAIVDAAVEMGVRTRNMDRAVIRDFVTHFFDRDVAQMSPPAFLLALSKRDKVTALPREFMLVARSSLLLRGLGGKVGAPQQCSRRWQHEARRFIAAQLVSVPRYESRVSE